MTATQPPLPLPWELEPCPEAELDRAIADYRRRSPWRVHNGPMGDHGRSAARADVATGRRVHTVRVRGGLL